MGATPQTQAITVANGLISAAQGLLSIYNNVTQLNQQWTDDAVANTLNAMATATVNADGSIGAVDGAPNVAHPITVTGLSRSISANQVAGLLTTLQAILTYVNGTGSVAQTAGVRAILNNANGG